MHARAVCTAVLCLSWASSACSGQGVDGATDAAAAPDGGIADGCPERAEVCDGVDNDCDGIVDEGCGCVGSVVRVDRDASGAATGGSWADAFPDLQRALDRGGRCLEIWIAEGTYIPTTRRDPADPSSVSFVIDGDVQLFGGFAGTERSRSERDVARHHAVLSGDLARNDGDPDETWEENAYTVIFGQDSASLTLDGLTVSGGYDAEGAGGASAIDLASSGSLTCRASTIAHNRSLGVSSAVRVTGRSSFESCRFEDNHTRGIATASAHGASCLVAEGPTIIEGTVITGNSTSGAAGVGYLVGGPVVIRESQIVDNVAAGSAGAFWIQDAEATIVASRFEANRGASGGALLLVGSSATVDDSLFLANVATRGGGAISASQPASDSRILIARSRFLGNRGQLAGALNVADMPVSVVHSLFSGNSASSSGGAIQLRQSSGEPTLDAVIAGCTIVGNAVDYGSGAGVMLQWSAPEPDRPHVALHNNVIWGNTGTYGSEREAQLMFWGTPTILSLEQNLVAGWTGDLGGTGNRNGDPLLVDLDGDDDVLGTEDDDARLGAASPCIDAGRNDRVPQDTLDVDGDGDRVEPTPLDLAGTQRFVDVVSRPDTGLGTAPIVDLGAHEAI